MRVDEAIAEEIKRQGVTSVFCLQSEETLRLIYQAQGLGAKIYNTRHEAAAVGMADGYARATSTVGVAIVGRGPGMTNGLTALVTASKGSSSVVVFAGDNPIGLGKKADTQDASGSRIPKGKPQNKALAQASLLDAVGVKQITLRSAASAVADVAQAFAYARTGATVFVNIPNDVMAWEAGTGPMEVDLPLPEVKPPDPQEISNVADLLEATFAVKHPVILAGQGVLATGAAPDLLKLGERVGALFATSLKARSLFNGEPYNLGISGTYASPVATEMLVNSDLVLAFGASLNGHTTFGGSLYPNARIVQFDRDPAAFDRYTQTEMTVRGDAKASASALLSELDRRGHTSDGYRSPEIADQIAKGPTHAPFADTSKPGALDPRTVMKMINEVLPKERTVVQDSAHNQRFSTAYLAVPDPGSFIIPRENGAVGSASYVALGVAVARPDRLTVLAIGDGGFMMTLTDFDTAVRYGLKLLVLVSNNSSFGAEVLFLREWGLKDELPFYKNPSLEAVAKALGADGMTVETLDDIAKLGPRVAAMRGPLLVDCKVQIDVPH